MVDVDRRFWPFRPRASIVFTLLILVGLLIIIVILRLTVEWPGKESETTVLIGILLFSLLPILLSLVDAIIERGGMIEYGGVKIDFSKVPAGGAAGFTVPVNIGVSGQSVGGSGTTQILDALRKATESDIVIIDLEEGQAWWETRLLVLLAGAVRLKKPEKVVFLGKDARVDKCFQGWGYPADLLTYLLKAHPKYALSYHRSMAAARQWELVEPTGDAANPARIISFTQETINKNKFKDNELVLRLLNGRIIKNVSHQPYLARFDDSIADESQLRKRLEGIAVTDIDPIVAIWQQSAQVGLAMQYSWMAFDGPSGLPNELLAEQLLQSDLGIEVESKEQPKKISLTRLEELFRPVLYKDNLDERWPAERQLSEFLNSDSDYLAVTNNGKYSTIVSRLIVLNAIVRTLVEKK